MADARNEAMSDASSSDEIPYRQIADYESSWRGVAAEAYNHRKTYPPYPQDAVDWAHGFLIRAAAFETGALENMYASRTGATVTIASESEGWEEALQEAGDSAPETFNDVLAAYLKVDELTYSLELITAATLRELHKIACASQTHYSTSMGQRELHHGTYKSDPNHTVLPGGIKRLYAPVYLVETEVSGAFDLYRRLANAGASYTVLSAFLHWAIAHIHPFEDGNGRTARVLASLPLLHHHGIPVMVFSDAKKTYFQALAAADANHPKDFWQYTFDRVSDAEDWCDQLRSERAASNLDSTLDLMAEIVAAQTEPREADADIEDRVRQYLVDRIIENIQGIQEVGFVINDRLSGLPAAYTRTQEKTLTMREPFSIDTGFAVDAKVINSAIAAEIRVQGPQLATPVVIRLQVNDCTPQLSSEAHIRLDLAGRQAARAITDHLHAMISEAAQAVGSLPPPPRA